MIFISLPFFDLTVDVSYNENGCIVRYMKTYLAITSNKIFILSDIDECNPNPCLHGGNCFDAVNNYTCICMVGFTGQNCQIGN